MVIQNYQRENPLTKEVKKKNRELSSERVANENVIGWLSDLKLSPTIIGTEGSDLV